MREFVSSFWLQALALAAVLLLLHVLGDWEDTGRPPRRWRQWRETLTSIVVFVALFAALTGGRGCTGSADLDEVPAAEPPPPR